MCSKSKTRDCPSFSILFNLSIYLWIYLSKYLGWWEHKPLPKIQPYLYPIHSFDNNSKDINNLIQFLLWFIIRWCWIYYYTKKVNLFLYRRYYAYDSTIFINLYVRPLYNSIPFKALKIWLICSLFLVYKCIDQKS